MKKVKYLSIVLVMFVFMFLGVSSVQAANNTLGNVKNISATQTTSKITLSWSKVSNATGYHIQKYSSSKKKYVTVDTTSKTKYAFSDLKSATEYKYRVRAYKTVSGKKEYSDYKSIIAGTKPATISKITVTNATKSIKLTWNSISRATGYKVYKYNSKTEKYEPVATVKGKVTYTVKDLKPGTAYKFCVKPYFKLSNGETIWGDKKAVKTATKPATPTLKVTSGVNKATLSWSKVTSSGYEIVYSRNSDFSSSKKVVVSSGSTVKNTIKNLTANKKYYFKVRAFKTVDDNKIYGAYSNVVSVTIKTSNTSTSTSTSTNDGAYYITETGSKYHVSSCRHLKESKIKISLADAKKRGYTPCKTCIG